MGSSAFSGQDVRVVNKRPSRNVSYYVTTASGISPLHPIHYMMAMMADMGKRVSSELKASKSTCLRVIIEED